MEKFIAGFMSGISTFCFICTMATKLTNVPNWHVFAILSIITAISSFMFLERDSYLKELDK